MPETKAPQTSANTRRALQQALGGGRLAAPREQAAPALEKVEKGAAAMATTGCLAG